MKTSTAMKTNYMEPNLSFSDRQVRFVLGVTMIAAVLIVAPETMGNWSIVLLASIPLIISAIIGWDPIYAIAGKSAYVEGEEDIQQRSWTCPNLGAIDRAVRLGVGIALIAALMTMSVMQAELIVTLLAVPLIATAITAWDPVYAALDINSFASRVDVETAEIDTGEQMLGANYKFPQRNRSTAAYSRAA